MGVRFFWLRIHDLKLPGNNTCRKGGVILDEFNCRTRVISGPGAVSKLGEMGAKRVFLVTDSYFYKNGTADRIAACAKGEQVEIFSDVRPDPTVELAAEGTAKLKAFGPDLIVALGGGSAMDCAKAMAWFGGQGAKLVAIPTTSGSGSEVTDFAILTHNKVKHPLIDRRLRPDVAILDSDLLQELPPALIADSGYDVICHALEAYVATGAGVFTDALARDAFRSAFSALPASFAGRKEVRLKIHQAATMAGMAFSQAGLGLCHAMAHAMGGLFHVPHGRLNAILLPSVVSCNAHVAGAKYAELARAAGIGGSADTVAVRNLRNALIRLRRDLELPQTLAEAGIAPRDVWAATGEIVEATLADPCCETNPMKAEDFLIRRILEEVTGRV
jgi:1-propanol dehydrogenase